MPPETLSWERRRLERPERPERPDTPRWCDRPDTPRWPERPDTPRYNVYRGRTPSHGNGRPVPWRYHSAESGREFTPYSPSRANDTFIGREFNSPSRANDEGFRPSGYRMDLRYNRFNREGKSPFIHRDTRGETWENSISPSSPGRSHLGRDQRSLDDRSAVGRKDYKGQPWERRQNDDRGSFNRRSVRGKSWENGPSMDSSGRPHSGNGPCSVDDKAHFEKKSLKRRFQENGVFPNRHGSPHVSNDQRPRGDKESSSRKDLRGGSCEMGELPSSPSRSFEMGELPSSPSRSYSASNRNLIDDKDTKVQSVENCVAPDQSGIHTGTGHGPVNDMLTFTSLTHSELARTQDKHSQDQCDKSTGANDEASGRKYEKDNSLRSIDWKPLKWTRSGSLSSRSSGFSHSGCSKSTDSAELKTEMPPRNDTPVRSPSGDVVACVTESAVSSEAGSRKKPRLGWGEGLAKFEKKKVEGPDDDSATKPGRPACVSGETSYVSNLAGQKMPTVADKSPRVAGFVECASPVTPSSVACSSSPGVEDKASMRSANLDYDTSHSSDSPNLILPERTEQNQEREFCLENVGLISVANLSTSLTGLFQLENLVITESSFTISTALNKLSMWRSEASKVLEETESQIDSLENDLNELKSDCGAKPCEDVARSTVSRSALQLINSSASVETTNKVLGKDYGQVRNEDIDTRTLKFAESLCKLKGVASSDSVMEDKNNESMDVIVLENLEESPVCSSIGGGHSVAALSSDRGEALCDRILTSNKDTASKAYEAINKLPSNHCSIRTSETSSGSSGKDDPRIKEKLALKKRWRRSDERLHTIKYRAFQHLWKEDLKSMPSRKSRQKSQKRWGTSIRGPHGSNQKHRSSLRYHLSNAAINFISKLLVDPQSKASSNVLKMPAMIPNKERNTSIFNSSNGLVEDPCAVEKERALINPWTNEEKEIFMDRLATLGKDFHTISSFINHKTAADCVEFYYKNHKSDWFVKLKKKPDVAKQGKPYSFNNYLVGSGKRSNRDKNVASLHVLGEASAIAANADHGTKKCYKPDFAKQGRPYSSNKYLLGSAKRANRDKNAASFDVLGEASEIAADADLATKTYLRPDIKLGKPYSFKKNLGGSGKRANRERNAASLHVLREASAIAANADHAMKPCRKKNVIEAPQTAGPVGMSHDLETEAADVLVGICCSVSSEATNACVTSSFDHGESYKELANRRVGSDDDLCSGEEMELTDWTDEERSSFVQAIASYGNDYMMISRRVGTKSSDQCKVFFSKARKCFGLGAIRSRPCGEGEDDNNGGSGDEGEGACFLEVDLVVSSEKSSSKGDRVVFLSDIEVNDLGKTDCKDPDVLNNMIVDELIGKNKPQVDFEVDAEMENGDHNESAVVLDPMSTALQPDIVEDRGKEEALSSAGSVSADVANDQGFPPLSCAKIGIVDSGEPQAEEQGMVSEKNSDGTEVENNLNGMQEASLAKFGIVDPGKPQAEEPELVSNNADKTEVETGSNGSNDDPGVNVRQEQRRLLDLNLAVEESPGISLGRDGTSLLGSEDAYQRILRKLNMESTNVGATQFQSGALTFGNYPTLMPDVYIREYCGSGKCPEQRKKRTENVPTKNYGILDGSTNRMATAVFGSLSSTVQHQALQSASVIPSRGMTGGNQVIDYQLYSSHQDLIKDLNRRKAIGAVSSLRNPGVIRSHVGISDPVAAIKLHYANVENYSGVPMANNIRIEDHGEARLM